MRNLITSEETSSSPQRKIFLILSILYFSWHKTGQKLNGRLLKANRTKIIDCLAVDSPIVFRTQIKQHNDQKNTQSTKGIDSSRLSPYEPTRCSKQHNGSIARNFAELVRFLISWCFFNWPSNDHIQHSFTFSMQNEETSLHFLLLIASWRQIGRKLMGQIMNANETFANGCLGIKLPDFLLA